MKRLIVWATLAGIELMAYGAAQARVDLVQIDWTGSISSSAATTVANCLLWHGLETMSHQDRGNRTPGRRVRAPTEQALVVRFRA
jgi:hypothetical protein